MLTHRPPLVPKAASGPALVAMIGRISTPGQDLRSIDASYGYAEPFLKHLYSGPMDIRTFGEQASGMLASRETIVAAEEWIKTNAVDLVIAEDVSRIFRNPRYLWAFVQDCVDHDTRVICPADNLDTADDEWEAMLTLACARHGLAIPDTRRRVRRTATHAFDLGGMVMKIRYGYRKLSPEEAASGQFGPVALRVARVPECTPTIQEMCRRIVRGDSYVSVADWLNEEGVSPGPYVEQGRWTDRLVKELLRDKILSGKRTFRTNVHKVVYKTGKHRPRPNPQGPEVKEYPELAHLTPEEHAEVLAVMKGRKERAVAGQRAGRDSPLWNRARSRSLWPGQHARCGVCGGLMYRFGKHLKCQNAVPSGPRTCWNHVQIDFAMVRAKVLPWVLNVLDGRADVRAMVIQFACQEFDRVRRLQQKSGDKLDQRIAALTKQGENLAKAIAKGGNLEALVAESGSVDAALQEARQERANLEERVEGAGDFASCDDVEARLDEALVRLAETSFDFADQLRCLLPEFVIQPVQALDCPQVRPRARLTLRLDAWTNGAEPPQEVSVVLDLFEPPEHIKHLAACVAMKQAQPKASLQVMAAALSLNRMTVKRALAYCQLMQEMDVTEPYQELHQKPERASRWGKQRRRKADHPWLANRLLVISVTPPGHSCPGP